MTLGLHTPRTKARRHYVDPRDVPLRELFPSSFMAANTSFGSFGDMLRGCGEGMGAPEVWRNAFQSRAWDDYVRATTEFTDWASMRRAALADLRRRR